ncbi:GNAT family N-acetyltransferase [Streptomyces monashensis]|uniref:GNAT family N-acetyltransferase n=1 Tax=Streptomyces monashensis TaxID=1678012 RepID=A0A1S2Q0D9_9ACTN|nr:GNAT family protein [Streptomyces monashensis]OIJ99065.1 GNAT family N-acetyltransferase [Streptomyces monashensis]
MNELAWPLASLTLTTPRLRLSLPTPQKLDQLAQVAADGIHGPEVMPFPVPWTDLPPTARGFAVMQHHWRCQGTWQPLDWTLDLTVSRDDTVIGVQSLAAKNFAITKEATDACWLGLPFHGQGYGTEMREAILHLAFSELGAQEVCSSAYTDNPASYAIAKKLGYTDDGIERHAVRGTLQTLRRLRLTRSAWEAHRTVSVRVEGLPEQSLPLFGLHQEAITEQ